MIGYQELIVIFLIVLLLFGGKKIPEIARGLGKGIREFKRAKDDVRDAIDEEDPSASAKKCSCCGHPVQPATPAAPPPAPADPAPPPAEGKNV